MPETGLHPENDYALESNKTPTLESEKDNTHSQDMDFDAIM